MTLEIKAPARWLDGAAAGPVVTPVRGLLLGIFWGLERIVSVTRAVPRVTVSEEGDRS